jgi:hypothetical protein
MQDKTGAWDDLGKLMARHKRDPPSCWVCSASRLGEHERGGVTGFVSVVRSDPDP